MCCGYSTALVPTVVTRSSESAVEAAARQYNLRKKRGAADRILAQENASETSTLSLGSKQDGDPTQGLSEKIENILHLDGKGKLHRSIANRWRKFKAQNLSGKT